MIVQIEVIGGSSICVLTSAIESIHPHINQTIDDKGSSVVTISGRIYQSTESARSISKKIVESDLDMAKYRYKAEEDGIAEMLNENDNDGNRFNPENN